MAGTDLDAAFLNDDEIPRDVFRRWMDDATDVRTLSKLYRLKRGTRIKPGLKVEESCDMTQKYLFECIRANVSDDQDVDGRYDAALILNFWFCKMIKSGDPEALIVLANQACAVKEFFLAGNEDEQEAIETGFLEHALETEALRPYFEDWAEDSRLKDTWERALEWGKDHPDFTWDLWGKSHQVTKAFSCPRAQFYVCVWGPRRTFTAKTQQGRN